MIVDEHDWRHRLSPEESVDPIAAEADIWRGDIATGAAVEAVFSKYRLWGSYTETALRQIDEALRCSEAGGSHPLAQEMSRADGIQAQSPSGGRGQS